MRTFEHIALVDLQAEAFGVAQAHGWWSEPPDFLAALAMIHVEWPRPGGVPSPAS